MEQRRRRHAPADPLPAAAEAAELRDDGAADSAADAERPADGAAEAAEAAASAADGAVGDAECQRPAEESLALIGQELVPLDGNLDRGEKRAKERHGLTSDVAFQTPAEKKSIGTPSDQLQLQNTPWNGKNEDSENRSGKEGKMDSLPNGPPTSYGPSSSPQMPLFSPQQVAQLSDPRNSTSMLPFGRDQMAAGEQLRVPGFFQALFPGYDQFQGLQEARQREFEWRQSMETMIESLGLELRASRSENQRLREELHEARKDMSRYGTPEDRSTSESPEVLRSMGVKGRLTLEDGAAAQQVLPEHALVPKKKKTKEDGTEFRQVRNKEDGTEFRQVRTKEDGTEFRQASQKEDGTEFRQVRKKEDGQRPSKLLSALAGLRCRRRLRCFRLKESNLNNLRSQKKKALVGRGLHQSHQRGVPKIPHYMFCSRLWTPCNQCRSRC